MNFPDASNAVFELVGGAIILNNVRVLLRDKAVRGVSLWYGGFFGTWGAWNVFYYWHLTQWLSLAAGCIPPVANFAWLALALLYRRRALDAESTPGL